MVMIKTYRNSSNLADHNIAPKKAEHSHIFMGNDNDALLKEMDNWPTYYPSKLNKDQIKEEMLAH